MGYVSEVIAANSLRKWQSEAWAEFRRNDFRGVIEVATGGGKTIFALYAFQEQKRLQPHLNILVIVPTAALQDQWFVSFIEDLGIPETEIAILDARSTDRNLKTANIVVIYSARQLKLSPKAKQNIFLVVDECHRAGSPENAGAIDGDWLSTLGLSATPDRQYDDGTERYILPRLGNKIFSYDVAQALNDGVLIPFVLCNVEIPLLPVEQTEINELTRKIARAMNQDSSGEMVEALLRRRARVYNNAMFRIPTTIALMEEHRGQRTIIFHESIEAAEVIADQLKQKGHSVALYHSKVNSARRRENLRLYRIGIIDVLVTCRALDEGANLPETRVAIIAAATSSGRQRIQRLGRVLRPHPSKSYSTVYSLYATRFEEDRLKREVDHMEGLAEVQWMRVASGL